jgi:iron(III) transport system ATP-binding protein
VKDFNLRVEQGEIIGLVGESGCGKTSILRMIAGFEQVTEGRVELHGECVAGPHRFVEPQHRKVGLVFQDYALFPHKTVRQNILFGTQGRHSREVEAQYTALLSLCRLEGLDQRYPHQLSGGQRQRVALARALAPKPDIILFDEPFSNLDTLHKNQMRTEIGEIIRESGATAIIVTHDTRDVLALATRAVVMKEGLKVQDGKVDEVYDQPANAYVARFFGPANLLPARILNEEAITALGSFPLPGGRRMKDEDALLCLRPDAIHFCVPGDGSVPVTILQERFLGEYTEYRLGLRDAKSAGWKGELLVHAREMPEQPSSDPHIRANPDRAWLVAP